MEIRMADKKKCMAVVASQKKITEGIYSMWLQFPEDYNVAGMAVPGQFISMYCGEGSRLLPRPISICEIEPVQRKLRVVYRVAGKGTEEFSGLEEGAKILFERYQMDKDTPPLAKKIYAFVLLYKEIFEEYDVDVISSECWTSMQLGVGAMPCTAYSILADMGYIVSCESDMHGAISMALLSCAALGKNPPFFGEFTVRHPEDKNIELLWHCGPFAYSLKKPGTIAREENQRQWFQVKDGKFTICRCDQDDGHYQLLNGTLESADGPYTFGTYLWARFNDLTKWERKLIDGPYIHHMAEVEGDYTWELREFCRLIPHLDSDTVD